MTDEQMSMEDIKKRHEKRQPIKLKQLSEAEREENLFLLNPPPREPDHDYPITYKLLIDYLDYAEKAIEHNIEPLWFTEPALKKLVEAHLDLLQAADNAVTTGNTEKLTELVDSYYDDEESKE